MRQSHSSALALPVYSAVPPWVEEKKNCSLLLNKHFNGSVVPLGTQMFFSKQIKTLCLFFLDRKSDNGSLKIQPALKDNSQHWPGMMASHIHHLQAVFKSVESEVTWDLATLPAHSTNHFTDIHSGTRVQPFDSLDIMQYFSFSAMGLPDQQTRWTAHSPTLLDTKSATEWLSHPLQPGNSYRGPNKPRRQHPQFSHAS